MFSGKEYVIFSKIKQEAKEAQERITKREIGVQEWEKEYYGLKVDSFLTALPNALEKAKLEKKLVLYPIPAFEDVCKWGDVWKLSNSTGSTFYLQKICQNMGLKVVVNKDQNKSGFCLEISL